jgi:hypothetical protein
MAAIELPDPYDFVRIVTGLLAVVWTARGTLRTWRFLRRWERRCDRFHLKHAWLRRAVLLVVARATVLDPLNLALMLVLVGVWTLRAAG